MLLDEFDSAFEVIEPSSFGLVMSRCNELINIVFVVCEERMYMCLV